MMKPHQETRLKTWDDTQIIIRVNKQFYLPGDIVDGNIYLNVAESFFGNVLLLKFKGREYVNLVEQSSKPKLLPNGSWIHIEDNNHNELKNVFHEQFFPIYTWLNNKLEVPKGQYVFPFSFELPKTLPGSFFQRGWQYLGDVSYYLKAILLPHKNADLKIKNRCKIIIHEMIDTKAIPQKDSKMNLSLCCSFCFCIANHGFCKLNYSLDTFEAQPNKSIQISVEFDNSESKSNNKMVDVSLRQKFKLKTDEMEKKVGYIITEGKTEGVSINQTESYTFTFEIPSGDDEDMWNTYRTAANLKGMTPLNKGFKNKISSSVKAKNAINRYFIQIKCLMEGCCVEEPKIKIPIYVRPYMNNICLIDKLKLPYNWAPYVFQKRFFKFGEEIYYTCLGYNKNLNSRNFNNTMIEVDLSREIPLYNEKRNNLRKIVIEKNKKPGNDKRNTIIQNDNKTHVRLK